MAEKSRAAIAVSWLAVALASNLSVILWRVIVRTEVPLWDPIARIAALGVLLFLALKRSSLRGISGFVLALGALLAGNWIGTLIERTGIWTGWAGSLPQYQRVFADVVVKLIPGFLMALTLISSGLGRRELFLVKGSPSAPSALPGLGHQPWTVVGPVLLVIFAFPLVFRLISTERPDFEKLGRAASALPLVLVFAALNAASEEFRFRSVLLARLAPVVTRGQALALTSVLFGVGHWFGHPSGFPGVAMTGIAGWVAGKSMLETRGFVWAWLMHFVGDVLIFALLVISTR